MSNYGIPGLIVASNPLTINEQKKVMEYIVCGKWLTDKNKRKYQKYIYDIEYNSKGETVNLGTVPEWVFGLGKNIVSRHDGNHNKTNFNEATVNEYQIGERMDKKIENPFKDTVAIVSLGSETKITLKNTLDSKETKTISVKPGNIIIMTDESLNWSHEIHSKDIENQYTSITFRTVRLNAIY